MQHLLEFVVEAEKGGFTSVLTSDHFHPWWHDNGFGNFTWVWLAAAAERTRKMKFTTGITAAVYRYNPGVLGIEYVLSQISKMKQMKEKEKEQSPNREDKTKAREYLKMYTDFECFVCGTKFTTNEERKQYLKSGTHGHHPYDTASPQEEEEVKSLEDK